MQLNKKKWKERKYDYGDVHALQQYCRHFHCREEVTIVKVKLKLPKYNELSLSRVKRQFKKKNNPKLPN